jgi:hypothetical protein
MDPHISLRWIGLYQSYQSGLDRLQLSDVGCIELQSCVSHLHG